MTPTPLQLHNEHWNFMNILQFLNFHNFKPLVCIVSWSNTKFKTLRRNWFMLWQNFNNFLINDGGSLTKTNFMLQWKFDNSLVDNGNLLWNQFNIATKFWQLICWQWWLSNEINCINVHFWWCLYTNFQHDGKAYCNSLLIATTLNLKCWTFLWKR
jgi:hypothetical protein